MKGNESTHVRPTANPPTASADSIAQIRATEKAAEECIQEAHRRAREIVLAAQNEAHEHREHALEHARKAAQKACKRVLDQTETQIHTINQKTEAAIIELRSQAQRHAREARSLIVSAVQE